MKKYISLLILLITIIISGCNVTQSISINSDKSGKFTSQVEIKDFFIQVVEDAATLQENKIDKDKSFAKQSEEDFIKELKDKKGISNIETKVISDNSYISSFDFDNFKDLFIELAKNPKQNILKITDNSIKINISMDNYNQVEEMIPSLKDPGFETFGPRYNEGVSEEEYYEMLSYILGEESEDEIKNSKIIFNIKTPSAIKNIKNGEQLTADTAQFTIKLVDFLLLSNPLVYELEY